MDLEYAEYLLQKTKKDYLKLAKRFSETRISSWKEIDLLVKKYVKKGDKILDVGCGNGRLYQSLQDLGVEYVGIDNCKELIFEARKKYKKAEFKIMDLLKLFFPKEKFDVVFLIAVFHHIPSDKLRQKALKNIFEVLKKGGILILTCWNLFQKKYIGYIQKTNQLKILSKTKLDFNDALIPWKDNKGKVITERYCHAFTISELERLLRNTGFKIKEIFYTRYGQRSNAFKGFNLCAVAQKVS